MTNQLKDTLFMLKYILPKMPIRKEPIIIPLSTMKDLQKYFDTKEQQ
jgi:hypothetical protein